MDKKIIMLGMIFGSILGAYLPSLFGVNSFSLTTVFTSTLGGILGIWITFKMIK